MTSPSAESQNLPSETWSSEKLYFVGDRYYDDALTAIASAKMSVELETYIYDDDAVGEKFSRALGLAAARGLDVRLLVDGIGAGAWADRKGQGLCREGVHVRVYHPVRFAHVLARLLNDLGIRRKTARRSGSFLSHLNRRDHRKVIIVDGIKAWIGSLNISSCHSEAAIGAAAWRDTGIAITGDAGIAHVRKGFEYAWVRSHTMDGKRRWTDTIFPKLKVPKTLSNIVRMNYTIPMRRKNFRQLGLKIRGSKQRVWITNAYLAPSKPMIRRLKAAAERGIDVRILLPRKSDVFFMPWVAGAHYQQLLASGVKLYEYLPRFIHAKSVIVDDWMTVGTSNLNHRSLLKDFEVDVVLTGIDAQAELEAQYLKDLEDSQEMKSAPKGLRAFFGRLIILFMKDWI